MTGAQVVRASRLLFLLPGCLTAFIFSVAAQTVPADGRALFAEERKGNCSACHKTPSDAPMKGASGIGPPLESIRQKYPGAADRARLRDAIVDPGKRNPGTIMPPYGKHRILTETEIDAIVAFLETL
jgi:sulfur-oxidizing protein SoxX